MDGMVSDGETVDGRSQSPAGPSANMWMDLPGNQESYEIADLSRNHRATSIIRFVAHVCNQEDDDEI